MRLSELVDRFDVSLFTWNTEKKTVLIFLFSCIITDNTIVPFLYERVSIGER